MAKTKINFNLPEKKKGLGITADCRQSWDSDDKTSRDLRGKTIDQVYFYVSKELFKLGYDNLSFSFRVIFDQIFNDFTAANIFTFLKRKYSKNYNIGLQRVYIGKLLRNARKRAEKNESD